jgi:hypothetical protein
MSGANIEVDCYIVVEQKFRERYGGINPEGRPSLRVTKTRPSLARDEVPVRVTISIPRAYWIRPAIHASVTLPDVEHDAHLRLSVADDIGRQISEAMSMKVDVKVISPEIEQ